MLIYNIHFLLKWSSLIAEIFVNAKSKNCTFKCDSTKSLHFSRILYYFITCEGNMWGRWVSVIACLNMYISKICILIKWYIGSLELSINTNYHSNRNQHCWDKNLSFITIPLATTKPLLSSWIRDKTLRTDSRSRGTIVGNKLKGWNGH